MPKRRSRLRFWACVSVTLLVVFYFAFWPLTMISGPVDVYDHRQHTGKLTAIAPLFIYEDMRYISVGMGGRPVGRWREQRYYFWFFGRVVKLTESKEQLPAMPARPGSR